MNDHPESWLPDDCRFDSYDDPPSSPKRARGTGPNGRILGYHDRRTRAGRVRRLLTR